MPAKPKGRPAPARPCSPVTMSMDDDTRARIDAILAARPELRTTSGVVRYMARVVYEQEIKSRP